MSYANGLSSESSVPSDSEDEAACESTKRKESIDTDHEESFGSKRNLSLDEYQNGDVAAKRRRSGLSFGSSETREDDTDEDGVDNGYETASLAMSSNSSQNDYPSKSSLQYSSNDFMGTTYSKAARNMMANMGHKDGRGLGRRGQGIVAPVEASKQSGRQGLGMKVPNLEVAVDRWIKDQEVVSVKEEQLWIDNSHQKTLNCELLKSWMTVKKKKMVIDDETLFCSPHVLKTLLKAKTVFDKISSEEMRKARSRSNPFESIKGVYFLNRAAMKMANMDAAFDYMFTNPKHKNRNTSMVDPDELLYFADVCAGPGGFSEYVLSRKLWRSKGFGFTLKETNDFKLDNFYAGPPETFEAFYGPKDDGNVFDSENILDFTEKVHQQTNREGVHFMMADGGSCCEGQENIQEIVSKQLYLCQCLVALRIVRVGGHFVVKLFDLFTPFSVGLVYLMYRCFDRVCIFKPNTSRPANSERYLVCKWKRGDTADIAEHLFNVNNRLNKLNRSNTHGLYENGQDVAELVPLEVLQADNAFFDYIITSNNSLGERQIVNLGKIAAFYKDKNLIEARQEELKKQCLELWDIKNDTRKALKYDCTSVVAKWFKLENFDFSKPAEELTTALLKSSLSNIFDNYCYLLGGESGSAHPYYTTPNFYLGLGGCNVSRWHRGQWIKTEKLELSPKTLVYGQYVLEFTGEGSGQTKLWTFSIIDAFFLGGIDVRHKPISERHKEIVMFVRALKKLTAAGELVQVVATPMCEMQHLLIHINDLTPKIGKKRNPFLGYHTSDTTYIKPDAVLFLNGATDKWRRHWSKSHNRAYYFDLKTKRSCFEGEEEESRRPPPEAFANAMTCFNRRVIWEWKDEVRIHPSQQIRPVKSSRLQLEELQRHIQPQIPRI